MSARFRQLLPLVCAPLFAQAEPVTIAVTNPSFEAYYVEPGAYRTGDITGWLRDGGTRSHVGIQSVAAALFPLQTGPGPEAVLPAPADGPQFAFINTPPDGGHIALYQVLGPLQPRTRYRFTVAIGNRLDKGYSDQALLELRNGDTPTSRVLASASNGTAPANGGFADLSVEFETGPYVAGNLLVAIRNQTGQQLILDHARVTAEAVDEETKR